MNIIYLDTDLPVFKDKGHFQKGNLKVASDSFFEIRGVKKIKIYYKDVVACDLLKQYGVGSYIRITLPKSHMVLFVPRINIGNWFLIINRRKTKTLFRLLQSYMEKTYKSSW